jgi:hypothetical protein
LVSRYVGGKGLVPQTPGSPWNEWSVRNGEEVSGSGQSGKAAGARIESAASRVRATARGRGLSLAARVFNTTAWLLGGGNSPMRGVESSQRAAPGPRVRQAHGAVWAGRILRQACLQSSALWSCLARWWPAI